MTDRDAAPQRVSVWRSLGMAWALSKDVTDSRTGRPITLLHAFVILRATEALYRELEGMSETVREQTRSPEREMQKYWWRFVERDERRRDRRVFAVGHQAAVWPPFWGHRVPIGGEQS